MAVMSLLLAGFWGWLRGVEVPAVCSGHREGLGAVTGGTGLCQSSGEAAKLSYT